MTTQTPDDCPVCEEPVAQVLKTGLGNYRVSPCGHSINPIQARDLQTNIEYLDDHNH